MCGRVNGDGVCVKNVCMLRIWRQCVEIVYEKTVWKECVWCVRESV